MQRLQGWVEQGNTTLTIGQASGVIARKVQGSFPGATVTVYINSAPAVAISSISRAANVVTVTVPTGSGFIAGEQVTIASVTNATFNGTFTILTAGASTFTYAQTAADASSSGGTATSTLRLATIYSDNSSTAKANPFVSASDGTWFFYVADGRYDIKFSGAGIAAPFTVGDIQAFDSITYENVAHAYLFPGVDASVKIANAIASLPSTGGIVDARGFTGTQTFSTNPFAGIPNVFFPLTVLFNSATFHVQTTMRILQGGCIRLLGTSGGGDIQTGTTFKWDGANGGTVLFFDTTRDSSVENVNIIPGTGTIGIGILSDRVNPAGSANAEHIYFKDITIGASTTGIQIGKDQIDGNNAEHTFEDVWIEGAGTYGYYIKFSQSKNLNFVRGAIANRDYGIYHNHGSSHIYGINFESIGICDIFFAQAQDNIFIEACHDENGKMFLDTGGYSGTAYVCYLLGNSWVYTLGTAAIMIQYKFGGPFTMIGNDWTDGSYSATTKFNISTSSTGGTLITSIGNSFPSDQVFTGAVTNYTLTSLNDRAINNLGNPIAMPNVFQAALNITGGLTLSGTSSLGGTLSIPTITGSTSVTGTISPASIAVGGDAAQSHLLSGTYSPTLTNVFNVSASSMVEAASYMQVGNSIIVSGQVNITPTAAGNVNTEIDLSVPILNGLNIDAMGGAVTTGAVGASGIATFEVSFGNGNKIRFVAGQVDSTSNIKYSFVLMYHLS